MKRIKVMQIIHDMNIGELQRVVVGISQHIDKRTFDVSVCALREGGPFIWSVSTEATPESSEVETLFCLVMNLRFTEATLM